MGVALLTTMASILAAAVMVRHAFRGRDKLNSLIMAPLLFPHAAIAVALLGILGAFGWVGSYEGIFLARAILCLPFSYRPIISAMRGLDPAMEEAAMSLGAPPSFVVRHVTLPVLRSAIVTSSFLRS